jgi:hypothetical protein
VFSGGPRTTEVRAWQRARVDEHGGVDLFRPAQRFDAALTAHGIAHEFVATLFGHIGHIEQFEPLIAFALRSTDPMR